jgi:single-stranded-DNA-specific exonuclease
VSLEELDYTLARLPSPAALPGIEAATSLLTQALLAQKRLLVVGDYDADGACACALAVKGLRKLGAKYVDFIVPDRFRLGYGLSPALVEEMAAKKPEVLITVDNGISSLKGVRAAKAAGMEVVITDHHLPGEALPEADAIVNPNLPGSSFPSRALSGVGVMFYVLCALRARLREEGGFKRLGNPEPKLSEFLDLVALGTVADVVPLDGVNRILVHQGLERMRRGLASPGIAALLEVAGTSPSQLTAQDLGFALGPRLNAAGRLEDMRVGIFCLLAESLEEARPLAQLLDALNRKRREIEASMQAQAFAALEPEAGCVFDPSWHEGVVGILAARLRDKLGRPVIAFAPGEDGNLKGSARSIPEIHIRDLLAEIEALRPGLLLRYGGHATAAGVVIKARDYPEFAACFSERLALKLKALPPEDVLYTDGTLAPGEFSLELAEALRAAGPWGQGFPAPLFHGEFAVKKASVLKEKHLKLRVRPPGGPELEAIAFGVDDPYALLSCQELRLAYRLEVEEFRGRRGVKLYAEYLEPGRSITPD